MLTLLLLVASAAPPGWPLTRDLDTEDLAALVKPSVVVVRQVGREGRDGMGTGFVIAGGLIVTNQHVIGEGRALFIETAGGERHDVTEVYAFDRKSDLAILRLKATDLPPLPLGEATRLRDGQAVVAIGNPRGLKYSVVAGVVSGRREVDGRGMIQVAIPVEPGNSGGPLIDRRGRVVGVVTMKSLVTENLGFAMPIDAVRPLLARPSPVAMRAWQTIGVLDREEWTTTGGATWRQRAGRILVEGVGPGFGGRSLCLSRREPPALPFEAGVSVKLEDEAGAAGLAFHSDGGDRHYGFYPSGGKLRFVRFDGPDVFSWKVIGERASAAYRPGEWNALRVRLEKGRIRCWVNDELVFDVEDDAFTSGAVGLAKFRNTVAEFKLFRVAKALPATDPALRAKLEKVTAALPATGPVAPAAAKVPDGKPATLAALREQARLLEQRAAQLRKLATALHQRETLDELAKVMKAKEPDLIHAALLIAKLDNDELDVQGYRDEVERMARKVTGKDDAAKLAALDRYLFREKGFHGSRGDYYNRSNSYLSEVIDDREGLPITLSLLYIELARRVGVRVEGVGLPGHFVVRHGKTLIDVFEGGTRMTRADAARKVREISGRQLTDEDLEAVSAKQVVVRVLYNLMGVARRERDAEGMLRYVDAMLAVTPDSAEERGLRATLRFQTGDLEGAEADVDWLLEKKPEGIDLDRLGQLKRFLQRQRGMKE
jgi:S1-C subfamily serine protease/regulator of sirC expression with transglutaminase-like and TPR domain